MPDFTRTTMASRAYQKAHDAQYATKNLNEALGLYEGVLAAYPDTLEAEYSRTQMHNIVKSVVPADDLLAAQVELTHVILKRDGLSDEPESSALITSDLAD